MFKNIEFIHVNIGCYFINLFLSRNVSAKKA